MLIRPRQVRRSKKFTTRLQSVARQRREYAVSTYSMAVVKGLLAGFMAVLALKVYQAFAAQAGSVPLTIRLALPILILVAALLIARSCVNSIRSVREFSQHNRLRRD